MASPISFKGFDHMVIFVRDFEKSVAFYQMLCGRVEVQRAGETAVVPIGTGQHLRLHGDPDYEPAAKGNLQHFNILIEDRDPEEIFSYLRANGAEPYGSPQDADRAREGLTQFRVRDPDGNEVELRMGTRGRAAAAG